MKQRAEPLLDLDASASLQVLADAFVRLKTADEAVRFLEDLCTPAELEALVDRWRVVPLLLRSVPYREIHERTGVSVTTIGRVARTLDRGAGGYAIAARRQAIRPARTPDSK
ncbi:DNA-binding transcriptional regulator [Luteimonas sp. BDR2-5]|uniref:YerC/YecD family TrpR-related protein n=1 Tax=Proluteimonas luteida TaxID=2878685 RepID=UPI001E392C65|nr:YerC/YecD family TrpR-related protein [Luteimonas sp. BDR2-5]MCD9029598.1 DNA-binding transcriptional regulator [Luteimonas sp. BDR2-5]